MFNYFATYTQIGVFSKAYEKTSIAHWIRVILNFRKYFINLVKFYTKRMSNFFATKTQIVYFLRHWKKNFRSPMEKDQIEFLVIISTTGLYFWTKLLCQIIFLHKLKLRIFYIHIEVHIWTYVYVCSISYRNRLEKCSNLHQSKF